jgi:rare lipoprotein A
MRMQWADLHPSTPRHNGRHPERLTTEPLPLGTRVRVTNMTNGKSTIVRINDRGPFKPGRVIDLSEAAAKQLLMTDIGLALVAIEVVR